MSETPNVHGWWQTLPGVLTAIAGTVTAVAGFVVALNQAGFFKADEKNRTNTKEYPQTSKNPTGNPQVSTADSSETTASVPDVAGNWQIVQSGTQDFVGTLRLSQSGAKLSGKLVWNSLAPGTVVSGEVSKRNLSFVIRYEDGVEGTYDGTLDTSLRLVEGVARGQGQSVTWKAIRQ